MDASVVVTCKDCKYSLQMHLKFSWLVYGVCPIPKFALDECLWDRFDHPLSTITVITGVLVVFVALYC